MIGNGENVEMCLFWSLKTYRAGVFLGCSEEGCLVVGGSLQMVEGSFLS